MTAENKRKKYDQALGHSRAERVRGAKPSQKRQNALAPSWKILIPIKKKKKKKKQKP